VVIGISTDPLAQQQRFTDKEKLNFPLYADAEQKTVKTFGVLMPNLPFAKRATFVIDKQGIIRHIYPQVANAGAHPQEVLEYVRKNLATK
jgi:peroxiredoxin Q/BCP